MRRNTLQKLPNIVGKFNDLNDCDHRPDDRGNRSATGPCTARTQEYLPEEQLFEFRDQFYAERFKRSSPA